MIFTHLFGNGLPDPVEGSRDTCIYSADALNTPSWNQDRKWAFLNLKKGCCDDGTPSCGLFKPPTEGPDGLMASLLHMSTSTTNCCSILLCAWIYSKCIFVNIQCMETGRVDRQSQQYFHQMYCGNTFCWQ